MDPITIINAINASMVLIEALLPQLQKLNFGGEVTVEQQQAVLARYLELKNNIDAAFSGPEWKIDPDPQ